MAVCHPDADFIHTRYLKATCLGDPKACLQAQRRYGIAIFGLGRAGSIHLNNILQTPRFNLVYLIDASSTRLEQVKNSYCLTDGVRLLCPSDASLVFNDASVDAVVVATPSKQHEVFVVAALQAGKHVLCEKPVALTIDQVQRCYSLAKQHGRKLLCAFNRRYDPAFVSVVQAAHDGKAGQVQCVSTVSRDSPRPSLEYLAGSGGIFHDCIIHDVDLICHTVQEFPYKVYAAAHAFALDIAALGDHDTVVITLQFPSGILAHIDISRHAVYGYDQRFEVHGTKGMLRSENQKPHAVEVFNSASCLTAPMFYSFPSRYSEAYKRQTEHFLSLLDGRCEPEVKEETVVKLCKIVNALEESAKLGKPLEIRYE